MSEPSPTVTLHLTIEAALLPGWFEALKGVAARHVRRMAVIEKPAEWVVMVGLARERVESFQAALGEAWTRWSAENPPA
mgnify:CR=1 FL=1